MHETLSLPGHEQAASFRVGAVIATQAIAVYVEPERRVGPHEVPCEFDRLPVRLRIGILAACEEEFRRRREMLLRDHPECIGGAEPS